MKRFFIAAFVALFAFACAESTPKVSVEEQFDVFNARMSEILAVVDVDGIATAGNPKLWFETLTKEQQLGIATKCQEFVTLQQEMTEWRKSLTQEETERLKEHMRTLSNQDNMRKVNIMQQLMNIARRVQQ
jgi:hypothetical protein